MKTTIKIEGMHCKSCEVLLTDVLTEMDGVSSAELSTKDGTAIVTHDGKATEKAMRQAIEAEGYRTK